MGIKTEFKKKKKNNYTVKKELYGDESCFYLPFLTVTGPING